MTRQWLPGPARPSLGEGEVHLWRASLAPSTVIVDQLRATLSQDEQDRAARFATPVLRGRYVVARGVLRDLLGRYLQVSPRSVELCYGEHGKPSLAGSSARPSLQFNVSHSRDLALFGFVLGRPIGVDLESTDRRVEREEIASRFFSRAEAERLAETPPARQPGYFFALWTAKEAFVKALGAGVSLGLSSFDVELEPGAKSSRISGREEGMDSKPWHAYRVEPGQGFAAAFAVEGGDLEILCWDWTQT